MSWRPTRDSLVLLVGALSAGALVFAAFGLVRAPRQAGEAELARAGGEVADTVVAEWERILRAEASPFEPAGAVHTWEPSVASTSPEAAVELSAPEPGSAAAVLLAESRRLELGDDVGGALDAAVQAAALPAPGAQAPARLRVIQLATRSGRADVAREQWELVRGSLSGTETLDGCSALLLCGLAAAPALPAGDRAALAADLLARLDAGRLPLPESGGRLLLDGFDPRAGTWDAPLTDSLLARLAELAGSSAADLAARHAELRATAAVRALLEEAGAPAPTGERWSVMPAGHDLLLFSRRRDDGSLAAFLAPGKTVRRGLQAELAERGLVAEGFYVVLDYAGLRIADRRWTGLETPATTQIDPWASLEGVIVRDRTALVGDDLGFTVWHHDPAAFVTAESLRARRTRAALLVMAAFSAIAAWMTARAMRRERELAGLRTAFIASVSHELRTPVASILLLVENLESGRAGAGAPQRYHTLLRREAHRLRRIVDDVLDMSRLERGRPVELRRDEVDLPVFAADLVDEARELLARTGSTLEARLGALPPAAALDADAMRRAVLNLVDNAGKHAAGGVVELDIARREGGGLRIAVSDRGPGVPVGQRQRIFEPFARGTADGAGPPGAGLGLSIVQAIVRGHGGRVAARDRDDGPGAVFEIELPPDQVEAT